jgi:hypothetical protein
LYETTARRPKITGQYDFVSDGFLISLLELKRPSRGHESTTASKSIPYANHCQSEATFTEFEVRIGSDSTVRYAFGSAASPSRGDVDQRSSAQFGAALVDVRFW